MPFPARLLLSAALAFGGPSQSGPQDVAPHTPAAPSAARDHAPVPVAAPALQHRSVILETPHMGSIHMKLRAGAPELPAVASEALVEIEEAAGSPRVWAALDPALARLDHPSPPDWAAELPLDRLLAPERVTPAREAIDHYVTHCLAPLAAATRPAWERSAHPSAAARAEALAASLEGDSALLRRTLEALDLDPAAGVARIVLVESAPPPGAMTYRTADGPVCIVAAADLDEDTLLEVTLHEALHAFDALSQPDDPNLLTRVREALAGAGLDPRDPRHRNAWHAIFFVHAAEMVRRDERPEYTGYADRAGLYDRTGPAAQLARRDWASVLDGQITIDAFMCALNDAASADGKG